MAGRPHRRSAFFGTQDALMWLSITTTHRPATHLGYLLHNNPVKAHEFGLSSGKAHVFYPEATDERCMAALVVDVDPVALVRDRHDPSGECVVASFKMV